VLSDAHFAQIERLQVFPSRRPRSANLHSTTAIPPQPDVEQRVTSELRRHEKMMTGALTIP
jgi:hypothetical protein